MADNTGSNHHDGSSNNQISSVPVVVPVTPGSTEELRTLCDALQRNDPNVTTVSTIHLFMIDEGCGRDLGHALQRNTVVSKIILHLNFLVNSYTVPYRRDVDMSSQPKLIAERMSLLLHWMEHSCSLRHVQICFGGFLNLEQMLLEKVLDALVKHQNILSFGSYIMPVPMSLLTPFLQANSSMQELELRTGFNDNDDDVEAAAQAVGALCQLEILSIATSQIDPFLRHLQASSAFRTSLRELTLNFWAQSEEKGNALCTLLSDRSCQLQVLALHTWRFDEHSWALLSSALFRSNPLSLLHTLKLDSVYFSRKAASLFVRDMQPNAVHLQSQLQQRPLHHIRDLHLTQLTLDTPRRAMKLGNMVSGSLLQHLTLDLDEMGPPNDFFNVLRARASAICLQSMHLLNARPSALLLLAPYIAATVHLRDLSVQTEVVNGFVQVPTEFLSSLRRNGSLHNVDLSMGLRTPNEANVRHIQAYTTRNRVLPQLMATTSFGSAADCRSRSVAEPEAVVASTLARPSARAFPTMGAVAEHAPLVAPNTFLKAFLAASESLVPDQQSCDRA